GCQHLVISWRAITKPNDVGGMGEAVKICHASARLPALLRCVLDPRPGLYDWLKPYVVPSQLIFPVVPVGITSKGHAAFPKQGMAGQCRRHHFPVSTIVDDAR